jgi:hypothetical protein
MDYADAWYSEFKQKATLIARLRFVRVLLTEVAQIHDVEQYTNVCYKRCLACKAKLELDEINKTIH